MGGSHARGRSEKVKRPPDLFVGCPAQDAGSRHLLKRQRDGAGAARRHGTRRRGARLGWVRSRGSTDSDRRRPPDAQSVAAVRGPMGRGNGGLSGYGWLSFPPGGKGAAANGEGGTDPPRAPSGGEYAGVADLGRRRQGRRRGRVRPETEDPITAENFQEKAHLIEAPPQGSFGVVGRGTQGRASFNGKDAFNAARADPRRWTGVEDNRHPRAPWYRREAAGPGGSAWSFVRREPTAVLGEALRGRRRTAGWLHIRRAARSRWATVGARLASSAR